jgi:hypothetical protein
MYIVRTHPRLHGVDISLLHNISCLEVGFLVLYIFNLRSFELWPDLGLPPTFGLILLYSMYRKRDH